MHSILRIIRYFWSARRELMKYVIVGVTGVVLDIGTLKFFKEGLGWSPVFSVVVNQAFLLGYGFTLNKYWSFRNRAMPHKQLVRYLSLAGFNYLVSIAFMYIGHDIFGFHYLIVRIVSIAIMVSWNFVLYKQWVYREERSSEFSVQSSEDV